MVGSVASFDEPRGLGEIETPAGDLLPFHCTAITDGSRSIVPGTTVAFELAAGRLGLLEATAVRPLYGVRALAEPDVAVETVPPVASAVPGAPDDDGPGFAGEAPGIGAAAESAPSAGADEAPETGEAGEAGETGGPDNRAQSGPDGASGAGGPDGSDQTEWLAAAEPGATAGPQSDVSESDGPATGSNVLHVTDTGEAGAHGPPDEPDPAATWPLGGGEPTPVAGTPAAPIEPADSTEASDMTGAAEPAEPAEGTTTGVPEVDPPWTPAPLPVMGPAIGVSPPPPQVIEATGDAGVGPSTGGASENPPDPEGQADDDTSWIRPSFDSAPFTGEVRLDDDPSPDTPNEPRSRDDSLSLGPDFWSPFSRGTTGPPPTWMTPVTRRDPDPGPTASPGDQDPESGGA